MTYKPTTAIGRSLDIAADAAAGRTALSAASTSEVAAKVNLTDFSAVGWLVAQAADAAASRAAIGALASSASKTLVEGDNINFIEDSTTVTVESQWGAQPHVETLSVDIANGVVIATGTGNLRVVYFTPQKSGTYPTIKMFSGSTAAAATPTLAQIGFYSVNAANDNLTLVTSTPNNTGLFATATTTYTETFSTAVTVVAGTRYAIGLLIVTAAAAPTLYGLVQGSSTVAAIGPGRRTGLLASQASLPSTVTAASLTGSNATFWARLV